MGAGYDRALEQVRQDCFERDRPTVTPINKWIASGFTVNRSYEVVTKAKTALTAGVKVYGVEYSFGANLSSQINNTSELGYFVMLAKFTSHTERAGGIKDRSDTPCSIIYNQGTNNTVGEYASVCGDAVLAEKTYGGHIMIAWRRQASTSRQDEAFGLNFGAKASDATIEAEVALSKLESAGYGDEEVLIEVQGLPAPSAVLLPSGNTGYSVRSVLDYLNSVSTQGSNGTLNALSVVDYKLERQQVWEMDLCLGASPGLTDPDWDCIYNRITERTHYLSEPQTLLQALGPSPTGYGRFASRDLFPLESASVHVGTVTVLANPGSSGTIGGAPLFAYQDDIPMETVATNYIDRSTARVAVPLISSSEGFCYLTSISGKFYNANDSVRIDTSDGFGVLRSSTPTGQDRNPGAQAQCLLFDQL